MYVNPNERIGPYNPYRFQHIQTSAELDVIEEKCRSDASYYNKLDIFLYFVPMMPPLLEWYVKDPVKAPLPLEWFFLPAIACLARYYFGSKTSFFLDQAHFASLRKLELNSNVERIGYTEATIGYTTESDFPWSHRYKFECIPNPTMCDQISQHLQQEIYKFRFKPLLWFLPILIHAVNTQSEIGKIAVLVLPWFISEFIGYNLFTIPRYSDEMHLASLRKAKLIDNQNNQ